EVDRFTKKLDLAVLGDQTPEEELVDDAPGLARLRGELVLREGLFRRFDRDRLRGRSGRSPRWLRGLVPPRHAEALEIWHLEGAILAEHLRCLLRIPKRCRGVLLEQLFRVLHGDPFWRWRPHRMFLLRGPLT